MAHPQNSFSDNAPGSWYVDKQCICCSLCEDAAPTVFRPAADYDHHVVHHQPATPLELAEAEDARQRCPAEAIGCDRPAVAPGEPPIQ